MGGENEVAGVESKVKRAKRSVTDEDDGSGGGRPKKAKSAKRREHNVGKMPVLDESHSSLLDLGSQDLPDDGEQEEVGDHDVMKEEGPSTHLALDSLPTNLNKI